jgi:hypothetical protein
MIYLFLAAKRERIRCCCRSRARAFIALDKRDLHVLLIGAGSLLFFKPDVLEASLRISGVELWEGRGCAQVSKFEHYLVSLGGLAFSSNEGG